VGESPKRPICDFCSVCLVFDQYQNLLRS
jgi:hypothetical protein